MDQEKVSIVSQCQRCGWEFCDDHVEDADHDCDTIVNKPGFTPTRGPLKGVRTADEEEEEDAMSSSSKSDRTTDDDDDDERENHNEAAAETRKQKSPIQMAASEAARRL